MVVTGIPIVNGLNELIISQNIADVLRMRLCDKSMHLTQARDDLSQALKEKYEYENIALELVEKTQEQGRTIEILKNEIKILQRMTRTSDPNQPIKIKRSASL